MQIAQKLNLNSVMVLGLLATNVAVAVLLVQRNTENVRHMAEVMGPLEKAVLEMEINAGETASAVFDYMLDHEEHDLERLHDSAADFYHFAQQFDRLDHNEESRRMGRLVVERYGDFQPLALEITNLTRQRFLTIAPLQKHAKRVDELLNKKRQEFDINLTPEQIAKARAVNEMDNVLDVAFRSPDVYAADSATALSKRLAATEAEFERWDAQLREMSLSASELRWLEEVEHGFRETMARANDMMRLTTKITENVDRFKVLENELDEILDEKVQPLIDAETERAGSLARRSAVVSVVVVCFLGAVIFAIVGSVGRIVSRGIIDATGRLTEAVSEFGRGNLDHRVEARTNDELGHLSTAFNEMATRLKAAREAQQVLDASSQVAIIATDSDGVVTLFNRGAERMLGYSAHEFVGRHTPERIYLKSEIASRAAELKREFGENIEGYEVVIARARRRRHDEREWTFVNSDGTPLTVNLAISCIRNEAGEVTGLLTMALDVSSRKQAEEQLREAKEYTDGILASMIDMLIVVAANETVVTVNQATCRLLGYQAHELIGRPASMLFAHCKEPRDDRTNDPDLGLFGILPVEKKALKAQVGNGQVSDIEGLYRAKDGRDIPVSISGSIMHDSQGNVEAIVCVAQDISLRKQLQMELTQAQKLESVGQLAAGIAHEINSPTQYIGDNTRFLKEAFHDLFGTIEKCGTLLEAAKAGPVDQQLVNDIEAEIKRADIAYLADEIPQAIDQSLDGVARVSRIVRAMKEFSHPGGEEKSRVNLRDAIETTITVARNEWKYVAEVKTEYDPELPQVLCRIGELNQVLLNLIVNAAHAIADTLEEGADDKGTITIGTRRDGPWAEIFVSDTGSGIPEDIRSKIFDPFFTTKEVGKGTGQGLAIARSVVVDKHGGTIRCKSELGRGTAFIVRLPVQADNNPRDAVQTRHDSGDTATHPERELVAEHNDAVLFKSEASP